MPNNKENLFVLIEDRNAYEPKYWVYEMFLPELICIIKELCGLDDYYIISKK